MRHCSHETSSSPFTAIVRLKRGSNIADVYVIAARLAISEGNTRGYLYRPRPTPKLVCQITLELGNDSGKAC